MLTLFPGVRSPRELRRRVSSITSAVTRSPSTSEAVRQTPLTATESPTAVPTRIGSAIVIRAESGSFSTAVTVARLSTMPGNISPPLSAQGRADTNVGPDTQHVGDPEPYRLTDRCDACRV